MLRTSEHLLCVSCGRRCPLIGGVWRIADRWSPAEEQARQAFEFEHRRFDTAQYLRIGPQLVENWLADVRLPPDFFRGKRVLDVGCGSGRWTYALASLGAEVTAVDITDAAVEITREVADRLPPGSGPVTVMQASLFALPFAPAQFDVVVSWGVLHHTPDTAAAFREIASSVKPGGLLYVMVYERRNPVKVVGTDLLRLALRHVSPETRYRFCGKLIVRNRVLFTLLRGLVACIPERDLSPALDARTAQFGLYDWYSPRYNHLHSVAEVYGWFHAAGFEDLSLTMPIKYRKLLEVWRFGQCGGSISMRGHRRCEAPERVGVESGDDGEKTYEDLGVGARG